MKLTLHLKQLRCHTFPKALTKAPSRGKEQAAHVVHGQVGHCGYASSCLGTEPEAAVEDYLDVRDIALNRLRVESSPWSECAEDERLSFGVRGLLRLWKDGIGLPVGLPDHSLLLIS